MRNLERVAAHRFVICDVFTDQPFTGNRLAVFPDATGVAEDLMPRLALEINFSETVFVLPTEAEADARIRIFTPAAELPFAGHPILGTAVVIGGLRRLDAVRLECGVGVIHVALTREGAGRAYGRMQQRVPTWEPLADADALLRALRVERSILPIEVYDNGPRFFYVALDDEAAVAALRPDIGALAELTAVGAYCFAGGGRSWKTRMFAPGLGVAEDPATGSAAGPFAVHLARHGAIAFGEEIAISQGVEIGRPSTLYAVAHGRADRVEGVEVGGRAVIVGRGEFDV